MPGSETVSTPPQTEGLTAYRSIWRNPEFVLAQALMLLATIGGIYLASAQGFKRAIEFDFVKSDVDGYNLRASIRAETIGNLSDLHDLIRITRDTGYFPDTAAEWPIIRTHVWKSAQYHPVLFETEASVLAAFGDFYAEAPFLVESAQENRILPKVFWERIKYHMARLETEFLPRMEERLAETRARLADYDAPVPDLIPPPGWSHPTPLEAPPKETPPAE